MIKNNIKQKKYQFNFYPSYYFYPEHHTRQQYKGHGKVYLTQLWGSTWDRYGTLNGNIQPFLLEPMTSIDVIIPDDTSKKKLKDILTGIKNMEGHYKIKIHTREDIKPFINQTRFITHIKED